MALDNFSERRADGTPALEDEERVFFTASDVECVIDEKAGAFGGRGTLHVSTKFVYWVSENDPSRGFRLKYSWVSMHAISRDPESFARPCIYCQLELPAKVPAFMIMGDGGDQDEGGASAAGDGDDDGDDGDGDDGLADDPFDELIELRLVPADESALARIFAALSDGAALNPDSQEEGDDDSAGDFIFNEEEVAQGALSASQQQALDRWDELLAAGGGAAGYGGDHDGQFDDAEDDGEYYDGDEEEEEEAAPDRGAGQQ